MIIQRVKSKIQCHTVVFCSKKGISVYLNQASSPFNVISLLISKQTQPHFLAMGKNTSTLMKTGQLLLDKDPLGKLFSSVPADVKHGHWKSICSV